MGFLSSLRDKISWRWEFGVKKSDKAVYRLEFVSKPISGKLFERVAGRYVQQVYGRSVGDVDLGGVFELPLDVVKHNEQAVLLGLPRVRVFGEKLLTKSVVGMRYERVGLDWVVRIDVEGIRRIF